MKDPVLIERMKAEYTGAMYHRHKDHYPLRFFLNEYHMIKPIRRSKNWTPNSHTFYFVREIRRIDA